MSFCSFLPSLNASGIGDLQISPGEPSCILGKHLLPIDLKFGNLDSVQKIVSYKRIDGTASIILWYSREIM
jgi:hypothetical protein